MLVSVSGREGETRNTHLDVDEVETGVEEVDFGGVDVEELEDSLVVETTDSVSDELEVVVVVVVVGSVCKRGWMNNAFGE